MLTATGATYNKNLMNMFKLEYSLPVLDCPCLARAASTDLVKSDLTSEF
jgi:hypothetical protein